MHAEKVSLALLVVCLGPLGCTCSPTPEPEISSRPPASATPAPTIETPAKKSPEKLKVVVHARHPHDPDAFTQGLLYTNGRLFESTGREGHSSVREVELDTGRVIKRRNNAADIFAEGLALVGDDLYQLSWQNGTAFTYSRDELVPKQRFHYETEGWGLCFDGKSLVMSDGTARLFFRNPSSFAQERVVTVTNNGKPLRFLNELECVGEHVYANIWQTDEIVRVRASDGVVDQIINAQGLLTAAESKDVDVLNGIAFAPDKNRFLITGKLWPVLFEVTFEPAI